MELKIKESSLIDVENLKDRLRKEDIEELIALGSEPYKALLKGYIYSNKCYSVFEGEKVIGMFGYSDYMLPKDCCSIWFLGSDESLNYPITFHKTGKNLIKECFKKYKIITNRVYAENVKHIKWLERLGMTLMYFNPVYINNKEFIEFYKIRR